MLTKVKSVASRIGNGILDAGTAMHNANLDNQINDLDEQAAALRKQLATIETEKTDLKDQKIK
jgi:hypothetical protein